MKYKLFSILFLIVFAVMLNACDGESEGNEGSEGNEFSESGGEHGEGGEGGSEGGSEGGGEGGSEGSGGINGNFVSSGNSRGTSESLILLINESYAGQLNAIEIAVLYDAVSDTFIGRLRNEAGQAVCDITVDILLDNTIAINLTPAGGPQIIDGLRPFDRADFTIVGGGNSFSEWTAMIESFTCSSAPSGQGSGGEGAEGGGEGGSEGSEGGNEGGGEHGPGGEGGSEGSEGGSEGSEGGGESGDESSPPIPLTDSFSGTFNNLDFSFSYDLSTNSFRGLVENNTSQVVCSSRTEVHISESGTVFEFGPTIGVDMAPGDMIDVVIEPQGFFPDTYTLHPESSPCP